MTPDLSNAPSASTLRPERVFAGAKVGADHSPPPQNVPGIEPLATQSAGPSAAPPLPSPAIVGPSSAPAFIATAISTAAPHPPETAAVPIEGIAVEIAARMREGKRRFEVRLDPPELGRIDVRLDVSRDGQVTSRLVVERAETLDLLRRDAGTLERARQGAGLRPDDGGLQFSLRDQSSQRWGTDDHTARPNVLILPDEDVAVRDAVRRATTCCVASDAASISGSKRFFMAISSALATAGTGASAAAATSNTGATIAKNFETFLQLLTTQLKNQNPLEPLDTNQFTQQLVQFAQVEQQIGINTSLNTLISLQQATQTSAAMSFLGTIVRVEGHTARLTGGQAVWAFATDRPAVATINVHAASGELVYTETRSVAAGAQTFTWNGRDLAGRTLPDGNYRVSITGKDARGQAAAVSTEVEGIVDGIDVTKNPPLLSIGGQTFTVDRSSRCVARAAKRHPPRGPIMYTYPSARAGGCASIWQR